MPSDDEKLTKTMLYEVFVQEVAAIHRQQKVDPATSAFLDAFIVMLRKIRDNPVLSDGPETICLMEKAGLAAVVAAGICNSLITLSAPPKSAMH